MTLPCTTKIRGGQKLFKLDGPLELLRGLPRPEGWGPTGPKHLCGHVLIGVKHLPSFGSIGPGTMAADPPLALGRAAVPQGEVLDLI